MFSEGITDAGQYPDQAMLLLIFYFQNQLSAWAMQFSRNRGISGISRPLTDSRGQAAQPALPSDCR
jgi:hypothetical protein